jgi:hypothetical protein
MKFLLFSIVGPSFAPLNSFFECFDVPIQISFQFYHQEIRGTFIISFKIMIKLKQLINLLEVLNPLQTLSALEQAIQLQRKYRNEFIRCDYGHKKCLIAWKFINPFLKSIYFPHERHTKVPFLAFECPRGVLKCQSF